MTCIVGVVHRGQVIIGGDSAGVGDWSLIVRADQKVFTNGPLAMGFTSSFRMGQLLRYRLQVPDHDPRCGVEEWMVGPFVDAVRDTLRDGGWLRTEDSREEGGTFLVGYRGRLFTVDSDMQVGESTAPYTAAGCGENFALGAMFASTREGKDLAAVGLRAAEKFSCGVSGPFRYVTSPLAASEQPTAAVILEDRETR